MKQKIYEYGADMGSIQILFGKDGSCYFDNNCGDGEYEAIICDENKVPKSAIFSGMFKVLKEAWLMKYDCSIKDKDKLHRFSKGRYFVHLDKDDTTFYISKIDDDDTK